MESASLANPTATGHPSSTLILVPPRCDRVREGRRLASSWIGGGARDLVLVERGIHPDLMELTPPPGKEQIGIDQVREVIRLAQFTPVQGLRKVCLVPSAEALTVEAANALLKILEEPPRGMVFIMLAEHEGDILPTIVSRSRIERMLPATRDSMVEKLSTLGYRQEAMTWLMGIADREGEIDRFALQKLDVVSLWNQSRTEATGLGAPELVAACLNAEPLLRRAGLHELLSRALRRETDVMTTAIQTLSAQPRETLFQFLQDLLVSVAELIHQRHVEPETVPDAGNRPGNRWKTRTLCHAAAAIDHAHRCLKTYGPADAVLFSLFFSIGATDHGN